MAVRPIDAVQVLHNINLHHRPTPVSEFESGFNNGLNQARWEITHAPTLTQPNEPLTLEELREMDEEPVYVVPKDKPAHCGGWCGVTVWKCDRYSYVSLLRDADSGWGFEKYGKTWIAYRRPPEEGAKNKNIPTSEPLTLEELRLMAEPTPVWWDWVQGWVLARKGMIISWNGVYYNFEEVKGNFYRRPPEGEEETP